MSSILGCRCSEDTFADSLLCATGGAGEIPAGSRDNYSRDERICNSPPNRSVRHPPFEKFRRNWSWCHVRFSVIICDVPRLVDLQGHTSLTRFLFNRLSVAKVTQPVKLISWHVTRRYRSPLAPNTHA